MTAKPLYSAFEELKAWASDPRPRIGTGIPYLDNMMNGGLARSEYMMVTAFSGSGKCVTGDTRVLLADGSYLPIESISGDHTVLAWTGDHFEPAQAGWLYSGVKPTVRLQTRRGRVIRTTAHHPYLTPDGWKEVQELSVGDRVAMVTNLPVFGEVEVPQHEAEFLGLYVAEGAGTNSSPMLTTSRYGADCERWAKEWDLELRKYDVRGSRTPTYGFVTGNHTTRQRGENHALNLLRRVGLAGCKAADKHVPAEVFMWRRDLVATFLRWAFNGDGWLSPRPHGWQLGFCSKSERLVRDIAHLCTRFGVQGAVRDRGNCFVWESNRQADISRFVHQIGIDRPAAADVPNLGIEAPPIEFDEIVSITPGAPEPVYDLTVPGLENFVAEDLIAHNTNFALNVCANNPHVPVVFYSLEMSARHVASRLAAMFTGQPTSQIEAQFRTEDTPDFMTQVTAKLPLFFIDDTPEITLRDAKESFRQVADQLVSLGHPPPRLAIFDYLELIRGAGLMGKAEQVDRASEKLRNFARELDISVIVLHQVSMGESEGPLSLTSGRYGGHAPTDVYVGLHRPGRVKDMPEHERRLKKDQIVIQVLKNRTTGKEDYAGRVHHIDPVSMRIYEPNQTFRLPSPVPVQPAMV